jgi:hypothetical protein
MVLDMNDLGAETTTIFNMYILDFPTFYVLINILTVIEHLLYMIEDVSWSEKIHVNSLVYSTGVHLFSKQSEQRLDVSMQFGCTGLMLQTISITINGQVEKRNQFCCATHTIKHSPCLQAKLSPNLSNGSLFALVQQCLLMKSLDTQTSVIGKYETFLLISRK